MATYINENVWNQHQGITKIVLNKNYIALLNFWLILSMLWLKTWNKILINRFIKINSGQSGTMLKQFSMHSVKWLQITKKKSPASRGLRPLGLPSGHYPWTLMGACPAPIPPLRFQGFLSHPVLIPDLYKNYTQH